MKTKLKEAAQARSAGMKARADRPSERHSVDGISSVRAPLKIRAVEQVERGGLPAVRIGGYASTSEDPYSMFDAYGPYTEIVNKGAFAVTLAAKPMVEYTVNHGAGGALPMAHTRNDTLDLGEDDTGFTYDAYADPRRSDVANLVLALGRGDAAESSFKFRIDEGMWSPDYTEFRIAAVDLDRGDVSTVNYGANPNTTSQLRAVQAKIQQGRALDPEDVNMLTQAMAWLTAVDSIVDEAQEALSAYLKVPSPDPDDATGMAAMLAAAALAAKTPARRQIVTDDDVRLRVLR
jgi:HK97 family phage prohead protease